MSTKAKKLIEIEKHFYKEAVAKRQAALKSRGLEGEKSVKDPQLRHLRAKLRQANRRLLAVVKIEQQIEAVALRKAERPKIEKKGVKSSKKPAKQSVTEGKSEEKNKEG